MALFTPVRFTSHLSGSVRAVRCSLFRSFNNSVLLGPQIRTFLTFFLASGSTHSLPLAPYPFCLRTSRHLIVGALVYFCWLLGPADPLQLCPASPFLPLILFAPSVLCLHALSFLPRHFIPRARILPQLAPGIVARFFFDFFIMAPSFPFRVSPCLFASRPLSTSTEPRHRRSSYLVFSHSRASLLTTYLIAQITKIIEKSVDELADGVAGVAISGANATPAAAI